MLDISKNIWYNQKCKVYFTIYGGDCLNNRIRELRKVNKVTQDDLAGAVGVTRQTIISLENGKYNASLQLAHKISKYFDMKIEDIFVFEED